MLHYGLTYHLGGALHMYLTNEHDCSAKRLESYSVLTEICKRDYGRPTNQIIIHTNGEPQNNELAEFVSSFNNKRTPYNYKMCVLNDDKRC